MSESHAPSPATVAAGERPREILIVPTRGWPTLRLGEISAYRELLYFLVWRDLRWRYRQTIVGAAWAVVQPLTLMLVFALFVGIVLHVPSDGVPYPVFAFRLLPWNFFTQSILRGSESLVGQTNLVSKVYVPRLYTPRGRDRILSPGLPDLVRRSRRHDALLRARAVGRDPLAPGHDLLPASRSTIAVGTFLAALNVKYRDVRAAVPVLTQVWFFATPVAYPASLVPEKWRLLYDLNPMVGVVDGFRWALLPTDTAPLTSMAIAAAVVLLSSALPHVFPPPRGPHVRRHHLS